MTSPREPTNDARANDAAIVERAAIDDAATRICAALADEPGERCLAALGAALTLVIRCAEPDQRMAIVETWCTMLRRQTEDSIRKDANR